VCDGLGFLAKDATGIVMWVLCLFLLGVGRQPSCGQFGGELPGSLLSLVEFSKGVPINIFPGAIGPMVS
jgi:hypothetical protein